MEIEGKQHADYFEIHCSKCGAATKNTYLGWDPSMPHFEAECKNCGEKGTWKMSITNWKGLPFKASE